MTNTTDRLQSSRNDRYTVRRIADILEYLLMLVVLMECNSLYCFARETVSRVDMNALFYRVALCLAAAALALRMWLNPKKLRLSLPNGVALLAMVAYAALFFILNVHTGEAWQRQNYILNFLLFMPLMTALFKVKQREGRGLDLIFKYSDIVCALAMMSLAVYLASVIRPDSVPADVIYCRWYYRHITLPQLSLLDVCQSAVGIQWQMFGITLLRNCGFFTEPLMFALPLLIALFTEMFLRGRNSRWRVFRWVLLTAALITVNSTIGVMLTAAAWGLKVISAGLERGKRWLVIPILVLAVAAVGFLYLEKGRTTYASTGSMGNSLLDHVDDYSASFQAFASQPLLGVGFQNEEAIYNYMQPYRLTNPGLSNTLGVVLAEGGLVFGALCLIPFVICLLYLFRKRHWRVACWGLGALGVAAGIIFKYHLVLMMMIAFGYSLMDVRWDRRRVKLALTDAAGQCADAPEPVKARKTLPIPAAYAVAAALFAALVAFGAPVWNAIHTFLLTHQFSMTQSPLRSFCFAVALLINGVALRDTLRGDTSWARMLALAVWDVVYLLLYPALFAWVNTLLPMLGLWGELREAALLLAIWLVPASLPLLVRLSGRPKRALVIAMGVVLAAVAVAILGSNLFINRRADAQDVPTEALEAVVEASQGRVYANDLPLLYRHRVKGVDLPATRDRGYEVLPNVSVVFAEDRESRVLMEAGFQTARLGDDHLLYTNDEAVVDALTARGTRFYRYYPFGSQADLEYLAELNGLTQTDDGAVVVNGPIESLSSGPFDTIFPGEYVAAYALHADPESLGDCAPDTPICRASLVRNLGTIIMAEQMVTADAFDAKGNAVVSVPFAMAEIFDNVEYRLIGEADIPVEVTSITLCQTPTFVTVCAYNHHRDVIRETYYTPDGAPYLQNGVYAGVERAFDMIDRVTMVRYLDADGNPVLVSPGFAEVRYTYNNKGSVESESFFGVDGQPVLIAGGYAADRFEYDAYGNLSVVCYYDADGNPALNADGYAAVVREYDDNRNVISEQLLDVQGNVVTPGAD